MPQVILTGAPQQRRDPLQLAARYRYQSAAWHCYRDHFDCHLKPGFALSAKYGLISEYEMIDHDTQRLHLTTERRIFGQVAGKLHKLERLNQLDRDVFVFGGRAARRLLMRAIAAAGIDARRFTWSHGSNPEQLTQLREYLEDALLNQRTPEELYR